ncbi:MAG: hypothetical protein OEZ01_02420 [Candidatus Heimdallarchaeota archaeon]|nr:hypothetical protein [Candidatus Heimdallarchaeota archaeon]MDH5644831.1 hypothetical protein [Candidatus Heimdallarchaeota archaeon]
MFATQFHVILVFIHLITLYIIIIPNQSINISFPQYPMLSIIMLFIIDLLLIIAHLNDIHTISFIFKFIQLLILLILILMTTVLFIPHLNESYNNIINYISVIGAIVFIHSLNSVMVGIKVLFNTAVISFSRSNIFYVLTIVSLFAYVYYYRLQEINKIYSKLNKQLPSLIKYIIPILLLFAIIILLLMFTLFPKLDITLNNPLILFSLTNLVATILIKYYPKHVFVTNTRLTYLEISSYPDINLIFEINTGVQDKNKMQTIKLFRALSGSFQEVIGSNTHLTSIHLGNKLFFSSRGKFTNCNLLCSDDNIIVRHLIDKLVYIFDDWIDKHGNSMISNDFIKSVNEFVEDYMPLRDTF